MLRRRRGVLLGAVAAHPARDAEEVLLAVIAAGGGAGAGSENESSSSSATAHASGAPPAAPGGAGGAARPYDVFVSYAHEDGMDVAARLEEGLARRGLRVWRDKLRLHLGDTLSDEIMRGLDNSSHAIVVVSPAYADRRWTMIELGGMMRGGFKGRIIPVLYKTDRGHVASKLPMLADRLAGTWDDDAEHLMDEIARAVKDTQQAKPREPTAQTGCGTTDLDLIAGASKGAAASIPREISGITVGRAEHVAAVERLLEDKGRAAIVGDKGSGKSVVSCLLYERLAERGAALLVRCDDFLGVESAEDLDRAIVPGRSLARLAGSAARASPGTAGAMTIIFDSLDAASRDEKTMRAFRRLLEMLWGAGARTVVTVRSYDYKYSGAIGTTDWGEKYELGLLSDDEVGAILRELGSPAVPPGLKKLLSNPLNLHLFSLVLKKSPDADLASIGSEIDLYDAHWRHYVELEPLGERVRNALYGIAEEMTRARRTLVPYAPSDPEAAAQAQSSSILVRTEDGGSIRYFHHAYLDYAMSRALLERRQPVEEYLRADEHNMFLRPTLLFALAMAHKRDPGVFASIVEGIVRADIKHHWKITALESLASVEPGSGAAYAGLESLFADQYILQRHFLTSLAKRRNMSWLCTRGDTIAAWASDSRNPNGAFIVDYLKAAAGDAQHHGRVFGIIRAIAENNTDAWVRRNAIILLADIDADGKAEWLGAMSSNSDSYVRAGVAHNLPTLLERDPDAIPAIFCSIYAYGEASAEKTHMPSHGTLRLMSTKAQDNEMNRWELGRMFPGLMDANPPVMMRAVILAAERMNRGIMSGQPGIVDDGLQWWIHAGFSRGGDSPLASARRYVDACSDEDFSRLVPALEGTRLASFRGMLIGGMARRGPAFLGRLACLLSDPQVHNVYTLRHAVGRAIERVWGLLDEGQRERILEAMGESGSPRSEPGRASGQGAFATAAALPPILTEPSSAAPSPGHMSPPAGGSFGPGAEDGTPKLDFEFQEMPAEEVADSAPGALEEGMLGDDLDRGGKIALLESILEALNGRPGNLDESLVSRIVAFLIGARRDADPEEGGDAPHFEPGSTLVATHSVRGLVAECLIRFAALRKDGVSTGPVLEAIRELSEDPAGAVRSDVSRSLAHLFPDHYDLARGIAASYSCDPDARVQFFLPAALYHIMQKDPAAASAMAGDILETSARPPDRLVLLLLHLALALKEPRAAELLRRIADEGAFSKELRMDIPFILKERLLANRAHRDAALGILYALLDDQEREVRHKAAFFTLSGFDDNPAIDDREHIRKIAPHLDRMSSLLEEKPLDLGIAEPLAMFLGKFWRYVPEAALAFLEKVVQVHGVRAASDSVIAEHSLNVLAGLLQHHSLYDGEWNRCLDVLDTYAAVGWPAALDLLTKMGERD